MYVRKKLNLNFRSNTKIFSVYIQTLKDKYNNVKMLKI